MAFHYAFDRRSWQEVRNVDFHVEPLRKHADNPLLLPDRPWETRVLLYGSVIRVGDVYRMWYWAGREKNEEGRFTCYAESRDGIHFEKPELDVADYRGMKTNIVFGTPLIGDAFAESDTVLYTPWDKGREYKMLYVARYPRDRDELYPPRLAFYRELLDGYRAKGDLRMAEKIEQRIDTLTKYYLGTTDAGIRISGVYVATSSDGIHWTEGERPVSRLMNDISHMTYDPYTKQYRIYGRWFSFNEERCAADKDRDFFDGYLGRAVYMVTSPDCIHWSEDKLVLSADGLDRPGDEIYSMLVFPRRGCYLGLVQIYHGAPWDMTEDYQLAFSGDGEHFERLGGRSPILALGEAGEWDRFLMSVDGMPLEEDGRLRFYYNGGIFRHSRTMGSCAYSGNDSGGARTFRIGMAECDADRFCCARASFDGGLLRSVPLRMDGDSLLLNADARFGEIRVRFLCGGQEEELSVSESGSEIRIPVPKAFIGRECSLEFRLRNARLYSYETA